VAVHPYKSSPPYVGYRVEYAKRYERIHGAKLGHVCAEALVGYELRTRLKYFNNVFLPSLRPREFLLHVRLWFSALTIASFL